MSRSINPPQADTKIFLRYFLPKIFDIKFTFVTPDEIIDDCIKPVFRIQLMSELIEHEVHIALHHCTRPEHITDVAERFGDVILGYGIPSFLLWKPDYIDGVEQTTIKFDNLVLKYASSFNISRRKIFSQVFLKLSLGFDIDPKSLPLLLSTPFGPEASDRLSYYDD
jgi:hypothetical protein